MYSTCSSSETVSLASFLSLQALPSVVVIVVDAQVFFLCIRARVVAYLARMLEAVQGALEGLNKQAFMTELVKIWTLHTANSLFVPFWLLAKIWAKSSECPVVLLQH